jgi:hypothetical protein
MFTVALVCNVVIKIPVSPICKYAWETRDLTCNPLVGGIYPLGLSLRATGRELVAPSVSIYVLSRLEAISSIQVCASLVKGHVQETHTFR